MKHYIYHSIAPKHSGPLEKRDKPLSILFKSHKIKKGSNAKQHKLFQIHLISYSQSKHLHAKIETYIYISSTTKIMNVSHNDINNIVQSELVADMARMILFFVIYGSLPHLLQPSQHHYARSEERSRVRVLLKYSWQMVMMSLVCVYWKGRMRADLPNTAETPIQNYMFYFFIAAIVGDVHFYAVHKLLHWNRYLYKHVHSHHHTMPSSDMEVSIN